MPSAARRLPLRPRPTHPPGHDGPVQGAHYTLEQALAFDAAAPHGTKYQWLGGEVVPHTGWAADGVTAAGASPEHNRLSGNAYVALFSRLRPRGCDVLGSDQRVAVADRFVYPDVVASCRPEFDDWTPARLLTPQLVVEVVSASTGAYDSGPKLALYAGVATLAEVWLASQTDALLQQCLRRDDGWTMVLHTSLDGSVRSPTFDVEVPLAALYDGVLPGEPPGGTETEG